MQTAHSGLVVSLLASMSGVTNNLEGFVES